MANPWIKGQKIFLTCHSSPNIDCRTIVMACHRSNSPIKKLDWMAASGRLDFTFLGVLYAPICLDFVLAQKIVAT